MPSAKPRKKKSEQTRERILQAAAKVVGSLGYAKASVTRIAAQAELAQGGFYYYFKTREALFEELLPSLGQEMIDFISSRLQDVPWGLDREVQAFLAYLEYLEKRPEFYRIFSEAYVYSPKAYRTHFRAVVENYLHGLRIHKAKGFLAVADEDLEMLAFFLIGIRNYVSQAYMEPGSGTRLPIQRTVDLYRKLLADSVFTTEPSRPSRVRAPFALG